MRQASFSRPDRPFPTAAGLDPTAPAGLCSNTLFGEANPSHPSESVGPTCNPALPVCDHLSPPDTPRVPIYRFIYRLSPHPDVSFRGFCLFPILAHAVSPVPRIVLGTDLNTTQ